MKSIVIAVICIYSLTCFSQVQQADLNMYRQKMHQKITDKNDILNFTPEQISTITKAAVCDNCYNFGGFSGLDVSTFFTPKSFVTFARVILHIELVNSNERDKEFFKLCAEYQASNPPNDDVPPVPYSNGYAGTPCPDGWTGMSCYVNEGICCEASCSYNDCIIKPNHPILNY